MTELETLRRQVEQAAASARPQMERLYTNGKPVFADPEHQRQSVDAALAELRGVVERAQAACERIQADAKRAASQTHTSALSALSNDELTRYALLRPLIAEELGRMYGSELRDRVTAVAEHGDAVDRLAHLDALRAYDGDKSALLPLLGAIERSLEKPGATAALARAAQLSKAAVRLSFDASAIYADVSGEQAAADARRLAEYRGAF